MKTRSNMPLFVVECSDVKALSNSQIDLLRCGDYLVKKDESGEHAYKVSFKKEGVGICLTYCDGSGYIETVSYDFTNGDWVYNSTDVFKGQQELVSGENIKTIGGQSILGSGDIAISGGTQLYKHTISGTANMLVKEIISTSNSKVTNFSQLQNLVENSIKAIIEIDGRFNVLALTDDILENYCSMYIKTELPHTTSFDYVEIPHEVFAITDDVVTPL